MILQRIFSRSVEPPENPPGVELTVLSNSRRRIAIEVLAERDEIDLTQLVDEVAEREAGKPITQVTSKARNRVYTSIYQTHLPKLASTGFVDYDAETKILRTNERHQELYEAYCRFASEFEDPIEPTTPAE